MLCGTPWQVNTRSAGGLISAQGGTAAEPEGQTWPAAAATSWLKVDTHINVCRAMPLQLWC